MIAIPENKLFQDLVGQKFGQWLVLGYAGRRKGSSRWLCRCDCGVEKTVYRASLKGGGTPSCGCAGRDDLTGRTFGRWQVLKYVGRRGIKHYWLCRCECGVEKHVAGSSLKNGRSVSCGCYRSDRLRERNITHGLSDTPEYRNWCNHHYREKKKKCDGGWTLTMAEALYEQQPVCVLCGLGDNLGIDHVKPLSRGNGLYPGNAVILCGLCNSKKRDRQLDQLPVGARAKLLEAAAAFENYWRGPDDVTSSL